MRKPTRICAALLLAGIIVTAMAQIATAQDPLTVAPSMYKKLFENERVRVMEVRFKPGESIAAHSHPDHFVYVATGGTLRIFHKDSEPADIAAKAGEVLWLNAETHWATNIGATEIHLIVSELKERNPVAEKEAAKK